MDNPWFSTDAFDGILELSPEMTQIETAQVTQLNPFKPLPHTLVRVQFRGISGQALQMESWGRSVGQELFDDTAAVNRGAIPDDTYAAGHLSQEVLEEGDHVCRIDGVVLAVEVECSPRGYRPDGRTMITRPPLP